MNLFELSRLSRFAGAIPWANIITENSIFTSCRPGLVEFGRGAPTKRPPTRFTRSHFGERIPWEDSFESSFSTCRWSFTTESSSPNPSGHSEPPRIATPEPPKPPPSLKLRGICEEQVYSFKSYSILHNSPFSSDQLWTFCLMTHVAHPSGCGMFYWRSGNQVHLRCDRTNCTKQSLSQSFFRWLREKAMHSPWFFHNWGRPGLVVCRVCNCALEGNKRHVFLDARSWLTWWFVWGEHQKIRIIPPRWFIFSAFSRWGNSMIWGDVSLWYLKQMDPDPDPGSLHQTCSGLGRKHVHKTSLLWSNMIFHVWFRIVTWGETDTWRSQVWLYSVSQVWWEQCTKQCLHISCVHPAGWIEWTSGPCCSFLWSLVFFWG